MSNIHGFYKVKNFTDVTNSYSPQTDTEYNSCDGGRPTQDSSETVCDTGMFGDPCPWEKTCLLGTDTCREDDAVFVGKLSCWLDANSGRGRYKAHIGNPSRCTSSTQGRSYCTRADNEIIKRRCNGNGDNITTPENITSKFTAGSHCILAGPVATLTPNSSSSPYTYTKYDDADQETAATRNTVTMPADIYPKIQGCELDCGFDPQIFEPITFSDGGVCISAGAGERARTSGVLTDISADAQDPAAPFDPSPNSHAFIYGLNNGDGATIAELVRGDKQLSDYNDQQVTLFEKLDDRWLVEVDLGPNAGHQLRINVDNLCPRVPIDGGCISEPAPEPAQCEVQDPYSVSGASLTKDVPKCTRSQEASDPGAAQQGGDCHYVGKYETDETDLNAKIRTINKWRKYFLGDPSVATDRRDQHGKYNNSCNYSEIMKNLCKNIEYNPEYCMSSSRGTAPCTFFESTRPILREENENSENMCKAWAEHILADDTALESIGPPGHTETACDNCATIAGDDYLGKGGETLYGGDFDTRLCPGGDDHNLDRLEYSLRTYCTNLYDEFNIGPDILLNSPLDPICRCHKRENDTLYNNQMNIVGLGESSYSARCWWPGCTGGERIDGGLTFKPNNIANLGPAGSPERLALNGGMGDPSPTCPQNVCINQIKAINICGDNCHQTNSIHDNNLVAAVCRGRSEQDIPVDNGGNMTFCKDLNTAMDGMEESPCSDGLSCYSGVGWTDGIPPESSSLVECRDNDQVCICYDPDTPASSRSTTSVDDSGVHGEGQGVADPDDRSVAQDCLNYDGCIFDYFKEPGELCEDECGHFTCCPYEAALLIALACIGIICFVWFVRRRRIARAPRMSV